MGELRRRHRLEVDDFLREHLQPRVPVVVTGEVERWPAFKSWTWEHLVDQFGDHEVDLYDDWFLPTGVTTFGEFVASNIGIDAPDPTRSYVRWFARNGPDEGRWADDVFAALTDDWSQPPFLPTNGYVVPFVGPHTHTSAVTDPFPYRALFVSARGARTKLHLDPWGSSAVLCQVTGIKRVRLYPPESQELMLSIAAHDGEDLLESTTTGFDDVLNAGEVLFIPAGWWHQVGTLTDSVSVTWNFLHSTVADNLRRHIEAHPDDPELAVVAYMLAAARSPGKAPARDVAAAVAAAMAAQDSAG